MAYYKQKYEADGQGSPQNRSGPDGERQGRSDQLDRSDRQDRSGQGGNRQGRGGNRDDRQRQGGQNRRPGNGPGQQQQGGQRPPAAAQTPAVSQPARQAQKPGKKGILSRILGIFKKD
jgi:translation initiation factor IF-2